MRMEPAPSEPWCSVPSHAAAAAPAPALEPPGVTSVFHGLREMPVSGVARSARPGPRARAAGRDLGVPRIAGDAGQRAVPQRLPAELRRRRLADEDPAG